MVQEGSFKRYVSRYAHCNGFSFVTYSKNGSQIITSGRDGDIRIWNGRDDDDPTSKGISEYVTAVAQYDERILVATDMNTVTAFTFPECKKDGTEIRFSAPATSIKVNELWIAAGSEDFTVKAKKRGETQYFDLNEHEGPIMCIDMTSKLLASRGGDGKIVIWNLEERKAIHRIEGLSLCRSFDLAENFGSISFDTKEEKFFAYCHEKKGIVVVDTETWKELFTLNEKVEGIFTTCSISPDGMHLAAGTSKGEMIIWNLKNKKSLSGDVKGMENHAITAISWNPATQGELSFCDASGQVEVITMMNNKSSASTKKKMGSEVNEENDDVYNEFGLIDDAADEEDGFHGDGIDEDDDDGVSLERIKNDTLGIHNYDDEEDGKDNDDKEGEENRPPSSVQDLRPVVTLQPPFQPGSTPIGLESRYMVWNHIGIVKSNKNDEEDSIHVEFHDSSTHHSIHINNHLNHVMASLSSSVLALACETPSKLVCITLKVGGSREWSMTMPDCEEIFAVCASDKVVAVATDARFLRIFTILGTQREVLSIPGPVVALSAHGDQILVAYHAGASATEDQNINLMLLTCIGYNIKCKEIKLPLTPGSKLTWIGFSEKGSPIMYDSFGILKLYRQKSNCWFPIWCAENHVKGASDTFFMIRIDEEMREIHAILCRGAQYPSTNPRPNVHIYAIEFPLCDKESEKTRLEAHLLKNQILDIENAKTEVKETTIKLFALACKSDLEHRARELLELIAIPEIIPIAAKYASGLGRIHLAQKLAELMPEIEEKNKEINEKLNEPEIEEATPLPSHSNGIHANPLLGASPSTTKAHVAVIRPKPIGSRNPFAKMNATGSNDSNIRNNKPIFSHFSEMGIGYSSNSVASNDDSQTGSTSNNSPSTTPKESTKSDMPFTKWLDLNRNECTREFPDLEPKEFNKACLKKYKEWKEQRKRKLDDEAEDSGIKKLAKFAAV